MTKDHISINIELPARALEVYKAWLDSNIHSEFTGGEAAIKAKVGGTFSAWDGYISGRIMELEEGERIVQTWRTTEFEEGDEDSELEVLLQDLPDGACLLSLSHENLPYGTGGKYEKGWEDHYLTPMLVYFGGK